LLRRAVSISRTSKNCVPVVRAWIGSSALW